ncbi:FHA domain-containing protein [Streptomyces marincola]|uniref:ABC transporter ATP-binding protein n=1 Tax=Streptomyces marincola TaxID=2878388 RepID=A0A1W7D350_9ACTN|nr:FHA domain-containing protein [Streptomyces marincola]ARQ71436.1 ABC transporter ATP-binding protein [Streptomyces marincola]
MPELVLELNGQTWTLDPTRSYRLGRDPQGDLVLQDSRVSWRHATVRWDGQGWLMEDHGSTNGTYLQGQRVQQAVLGPGTTVHLGNPTDGPRLSFSGAARVPHQQHSPSFDAFDARATIMAGQQPAAHQPPHQPPPQHRQAGGNAGGDRGATSLHQLAIGQVTRIGRALENELVVSDLQVSRFHAEFLAHPDGRFEIHDLGSHNGTYVNGQQLPKNGRRDLGHSDTVGIGHSTFRLVGNQLQEYIDTGEISFSARHLTVQVNNGRTTILNDVSFGVPEKSLVGVIGPSGSGKSTLLRALTGYRPATYGEVLYDHRNLYTHFAELRHRIGLVPQDDILHTALQVRQALRLAAKLRFPGDVADAERDARVEEVLAELKLSHHADKRISSLSGGQRKRVSVALELLTKPSLIFLDEPTSGLDPGMDRDVMQLLRGLADDGRTVLVVTHSVAELGLCDRVLVMAPGGGVAYFGPPDEALNFFGYETWADVFSAFENYRDYDWMGRWRGSQHYQMYAADLDAVQPQATAFQPMAVQQKAQSWGSQVLTLMRRYAAVIMADKGFLGLTLALPIVLGVVSTFVPAEDGLGYGTAENGGRNGDASIILLILVVGMCFTGAANAVRELIKERVIYERERAVGLSRSAYLMSKVFVLGIVTVIQGAILSLIGFLPREMPEEGVLFTSAPALEMTLVLMVLGCTSMMVGLVISALVRTSEMTMPLLVMISVVQLVFTGSLFQVHGSLGVEQLAWLMPSRWALAGTGTTVDLNVLTASPTAEPDPDPLWKPEAGYWLLDVSMLIVIGVVCGYLVMKFLRRHEPEVMRK